MLCKVKHIISASLLLLLVACSGKISVPIEDLTRAKATVKIVNGFSTTTNTSSALAYRVKKGDTLYAVAFRFGWDYKALAKLNNIPSPYVIYVDELIAFTPDYVTRKPISSATKITSTTSNKSSAQVATTTSKPQTSTTAAAKPVEKTQVVSKPTPSYAGTTNITWQWPLRGKLVNKFNARSETSKGIDMQIPIGSAVKAAAKGQVVYAGNGIQGYGNLLILKHNDTYLSAYAYNSQLLVSEGDIVNLGQQVALSGKGPKFAELLHFEIRKDGKPVDPLQFLPK